MKKYLTLISIILIVIATSVFAASPPYPETARTIALRDEISSADTTVETLALSDTARIGGYSNIVLEFDVGGTTPSFRTILYYSTDTAWVESGRRTITTDTAYVARTFGYELMTVFIDTISGTSPVIDVNIVPFND